MKPRSSTSKRGTSTALRCAACGRPYLPAETSCQPFCSERCRVIDLGRWLGEEIGIPHEGDPGDAPVEYREEPED